MNQEMQQTSEYMRDLAKGLDPFTKEPLPMDTILNDIGLARSFYYVADVLDALVRNGGSLTERKKNLVTFEWTEEMNQHLPFSDSPTITEFVRRINKWAAASNMRRLAYQRITTWLLDYGYLKEVLDDNQKKRRMPTAEGEAIGLQIEARFGMYSNYEVILYTPKAQRFIGDHMGEILSYREKDRTKEQDNDLDNEVDELFDMAMEEVLEEVV